MNTPFNLLDEPWIPIRRLSGSTDEVSLLTLFREADQIEGVHGEIASQDIAILRLLLAICHRTLKGPENFDAWRQYWDKEKDLGTACAEYLEKYRDRFDLRHPIHPFFQVAGIHSASGKTSSLESIIVDVPNGHPFFTTRLGKGLESISWAEAARWLVHVHAFDPSGIRSGAVGDPAVKGGKGYPIGPGWTGQIGSVTVLGDSLEQTLLLNTVVPGTPGLSLDVDIHRDLPPWEEEQRDVGMSVDREPTGPVSCYTWQTRRILLHGDNNSVTSLFIGNGDKATPQNRFHVEPMTAWRYSEPQTKKLKSVVYMPRKHPTDRAFWRGLSSVIGRMSPTETIKGVGEVTRFKAPDVVNFYQELIDEEVVPRSGLVPLRATGIEYGSQEAVVVELIDDHLFLPTQLLDRTNKRLLQVTIDAMEESEKVAACVGALASNLDRARGGDPDTSKAANTHAKDSFYTLLDQLFPRWLTSLEQQPEPTTARNGWRRTLREEALKQSHALVDTLPPRAFAGRGDGTNRMDVSRALFFFQRRLKEILPEETHTPHTEDRRSE
ncbi:MAG: type I-E CRISPR-associated protein Cse1/CasA [Actinomycetaceae bacterium]|nr:type I-E CRISPR-associated protein Cse1/CasA [Actinomycetaceae bacterium]